MGSLNRHSQRPSDKVPTAMDGRTEPCQPDKRVQMVAWALVHRVPIDALVGRGDIAKACSWFGLPVAEWEGAILAAPAIREQIEAKRARRLAWKRCCGLFSHCAYMVRRCRCRDGRDPGHHRAKP